MTYQYSLVAVGGTFDRFHKGHESLLCHAFKVGKNVIIGITSASMNKTKYLHETIASYRLRKQSVERYLKKYNVIDRSRIVCLHDPLGPLKTNSKIEAIVIGPKILSDSLTQLPRKIPVISAPAIYDQAGCFISSTNIRKGTVSREGYLFNLPDKPLLLPQSLRKTLQKPFGTLSHSPNFSKNNSSFMTIAVGDATSRFLITRKHSIDIAIVDFCIMRKKIYHSLQDLGFSADYFHHEKNIKNPAGTIQPNLVHEIKNAVERFIVNRERSALVVEGEDDLAVLASIIASPLSTVVYYGQPEKGIVSVVVTEEKKKTANTLLSQFTFM